MAHPSPILSAPGTLVLLQGNQAIARGAVEARVAWASGYPGNPSSEILETLAEIRDPGRLYVEWSVNEKVALEGALAASLSGLRALCTMKQNGVNVCLDTLTTLAQSGVGAGLVVVTADDPSGISSSNEQDSRFAAALAHIPLLEPDAPQTALDMTRYAFDLSEQLHQVVMIRSLSRVSHTRAGVRLGPVPPGPGRARFDTRRPFHSFPVVAKHQAMYKKLDQARDAFETSPFNHYAGPEACRRLIVAVGPSALYAREALERTGLDGEVGLATLGTTYPLPTDWVLKHLAPAEEVLVAEEIDPVLERNLKALYADHVAEVGVKRFYGKVSGHISATGELGPDALAEAVHRLWGGREAGAPGGAERTEAAAQARIPPREFGFCPGCPHRASYWAIKNALAADDRMGFVSGDIGCYTMAIWPTGFGQVKSVHCMGSGVGLSSGFGRLSEFGFDQPVISVVGDSTFFHAAVPALINAAYNKSSFVLVVLDNSATAMTGFQPHPGTGRSASGEAVGRISIEAVCRSLGLAVTIVDPYDLAAAERELARAIGAGRLEVLVFRRKCALVQGREGGFRFKMKVDPDLCRGESCGCHRFCHRVFRCPGLVWDPASGRARVDEVTCVGCGVCAQICPAGAIVREEA